MRVKRGERGGWKKGTWGRRMVGVREREDSKGEGGSRTSTIATVSRHNSSRFYVCIPPPGQGQIIHIPLRPLSFRTFFNCLRPHRAFCHLWSAPFASPPVTAPTPGAVLLCHLVGSSSVCQPNPPPNTVARTPPALTPCPNWASCLTLDAERHTTSALVVHYRVPDLLFLLYRRIYKANALLSFPS